MGLFRCLCFLCACALGAAAARGDSLNPWIGQKVKAELTDISPSTHLEVLYDADGSGSGSAELLTGRTGVFNWVPQAGSNNIFPFNRAFQSFCIDIQQAYETPSTFTIARLETSPVTDPPGVAGSGPNSTFMSVQQADYLRELWGESYAGIWTGTAQEQVVKATAFQLTIWEILFESSTSTTNRLGGGYFKVKYGTTTPPSYVTQANAYMAATYDTGYSAYETNLIALTSTYGQDHLALVPLPAACWGGLALMGAVGFRAWRNRARPELA